ncbi:hypothetical protein LG296_07335 [Ureibacillus chungkukjangi]|uniref:hypothetical protein n=1 Tax=Ureibacillus chungkukjangi TaxID=1202712 RepID=UPI00384BC2A5
MEITEKKKGNWFKNALSNQNQLEDTVKESIETEIELEQEPQEQVDTITNTVEESAPLVTDNTPSLFSKENQDKIALDVIVSIENILKERQLLAYKNDAMMDQINAANETIYRFKREMLKKDQLLQDKNKEIRELENTLTNKQMSYDQLLEDYKEYQLSSNLEFDKISNQLDTEKAKYNKLYEESTKTHSVQVTKINELEEKIRNLEIENQKFEEQYHKISNEKADLMKSINDFTERMSFSFTPKNND